VVFSDDAIANRKFKRLLSEETGMSLNPLVDSRDRMLRPAEQPNPDAYVHIKKNPCDLDYFLDIFSRLVTNSVKLA
jgi:hypothetical protein